MRNLLIGLLALSSLSVFAGDLKCANEDARETMTKVLNYHRSNAGLKAVSAKEVFGKEVFLDGEIREVYPVIKTVGELNDLILSSSAAKEVGEGIGFAIGYTLVINNKTGNGKKVNPKSELAKSITEKFCL